LFLQSNPLNENEFWRSRLLPPLLLIALAFPLLGWASGSLPLTGPDEPRYASIGRAMLESGDYVTPRLAGQPWFEKPALTYWLMAVSYRIFGINEFAARFPSILLALLAILAIYFTAERFISPQAALVGALSLETSVGFIVFSRAAATDMILTATLAFALCAFLLSEQAAQVGESSARLIDRRWFWLFLFYFSIGLTILAKGLAGIALGGGIIGLYLIIVGRLWRFLGLHILWGAVVVLAVSATWYGPVIARHGYPFIQEFFIQHHFARYTTNKYHHPGPFYYYVIAIIVAVFPFSFLLPISVWRFRARDYFKESLNQQNSWRIFALLWTLFPVIFFSFSGSKLPAYILPAVPGAALLMTTDFDDLWSGRAKRSQWMAFALIAILIVGGGIAMPFLKKINIDLQMRIALAVVMIAAGIAIFMGSLRRLKATVIATFTIMVVLVLVVGVAIQPQITERQSVRPLATFAARVRQPNEPIVFSGDLPRIVHGFTFYTDSRITYDEDTHGLTLEQVADEAVKNGSILCVTNDQQSLALAADRRLNVEVLGRQHNILLVRVTYNKQQ